MQTTRDLHFSGVPYKGCRFEAAKRLASAIDEYIIDNCPPNTERFWPYEIDISHMVQARQIRCSAFVTLTNPSDALEMMREFNARFKMTSPMGTSQINVEFSSQPARHRFSKRSSVCWRRGDNIPCLQACSWCAADAIETEATKIPVQKTRKLTCSGLNEQQQHQHQQKSQPHQQKSQQQQQAQEREITLLHNKGIQLQPTNTSYN